MNSSRRRRCSTRRFSRSALLARLTIPRKRERAQSKETLGFSLPWPFEFYRETMFQRLNERGEEGLPPKSSADRFIPHCLNLCVPPLTKFRWTRASEAGDLG